MSEPRTLTLVALVIAAVTALVVAARDPISTAVAEHVPAAIVDALPPAAEAPASQEPAEASALEPSASDTGEAREMDLEHLTPEDLTFLEEILSEGIPEARRSATRALVIAGHPAGMGMLLARAVDGDDDADLFCLAALEIARLQKKEEVLRALLLALEQTPALNESCRYEVSDRFAIVSAGDPLAVLPLIADPEPVVRSWALKSVSDVPGEDVDAALLAALADPEPDLRRQAWMAWAGREIGANAEALQAAMAAEGDVEIRAAAREILEAG